MPPGVVGVADIDDGDVCRSGRGKEKGREGRGGHTVKSWESLHNCAQLEACGMLVGGRSHSVGRADYVSKSLSIQGLRGASQRTSLVSTTASHTVNPR